MVRLPVTRRQIGAAAVVVVVLLVGWLIGDLSGTRGASAEGTDSSTAATIAAPATSSTALTTTTRATTTTTTPTTTTTIVPGAAAIELFVGEYRLALDNDDVAFLFTSLHPRVKDGYGVELCREWVAREIALLDSYELTGPLIGPSTATISTATGTFEVEDLYSGSISFIYQGASFEDQAQFAVQDGSIYWLGICR